MSKYYKAEDVIRAIAENLCWIARTEYGDKFTTEDWLEEAEDYVSDLPTIEVSEDCISRKWLEEHIEVVSYKNMWYETETDEFVSWANIENAPSVVPTTEQSSKVDIVRCKDCKHRYVTGATTQYYVCDFMDAEYRDDGYCHRGERIEG